MGIVLHFQGDLDGLRDGIRTLEPYYGFRMGDAGVRVNVRRTDGDIRVIFREGAASIEFCDPIHFFRALGLLLEALQDQKQHVELTETPQFRTNGIMVDCSRNAVMKPATVHKLLRHMAVMGLNMLMLYTEDTYTVEDEPFFGYLRGRYDADEIRSIDDYAAQFGIEMIPCIQTLGHMSMVLKWPAYRNVTDNEQVLLAGEEETYALIDKMIRAASAPLRSTRIHIGMDEAWGMGFGQYWRRNGYREPLDVFNDHLQRVLDITSRYGLEPMIWSDTFLHAAAKRQQSPEDDTAAAGLVEGTVPTGVQFVYWDYFTRDEQFYQDTIRKHKQLGSVPVFSGGVVACSTFAANSARTMESTNAALTACKREGVEEVFATIWGDDAAEYHPFTALLGFQLYAEHGYAAEPDRERLKRRVRFCTGIEYEAFMELSLLDNLNGINQSNRWPPNVSKYVFWQDPLLGLHDKDIEQLHLDAHYRAVHERLAMRWRQREGEAEYFRVPLLLSDVLSLKSEIGIRMKDCYDRGDRDGLRDIAERDLPELARRIRLMREAHREQWLALNKPFGWEVLDLRYSGLLGRIDTAAYRIDTYLAGRAGRIEELEEERLPLDMTPNGLGNGIWRKYKKIASPNVLME